MPTRLQQRLLTRHPLIWNTRLVAVTIAIITIHAFFFLAGFAALTAPAFKNHSSLNSLLSGSLFTFSVLCSLLVIIVWLVFYLRNNAFKSFYIIGKYHSAKEFLVIVFVILFSISFYESYKWGGWLKAHIITDRQQLVNEVNTANLALAFIPTSKSEFFKLNNCDRDREGMIVYTEDHNYYDTTFDSYNDSINVSIRNALAEKDAFTYKNYCDQLIYLRNYKGFIPAKEWTARRNKWIDENRADSIRYIIEQFQAICRKYQVEQHLDAKELAQLVFADSLHTITRIFPSRYSDQNPNGIAYIEEYELRNALEFADSTHLGHWRGDNTLDFFTAELYVALCLSILLLVYRLYSRRVFLIGFVGTIVWAIFSILVGISSGSPDGILVFCLILFFLFTVAGHAYIKGSSNKTIVGVALNWHVYLLPFVIMFIALMIESDFERHKHPYIWTSVEERDAWLQQRFPIGYWVSEHMGLIFRLNLLLVFLYVTFIFTRVSKKWHIMPEE